MKNILKPPLLGFHLISLLNTYKWQFARSLQMTMFCLAVGIGAIHFFEIYCLIKPFELMTAGLNIPIVSEWIGRVSNTYKELTGLANVLQFAWLSTLIMICVNLLIALPELRKRQAIQPQEDERDVIERAIFQKLYHSWFTPVRNKPLKPKAGQKQISKAQISDKTLAAMIAANLHRPPAVVNYILSLMMIIYFLVFSEAGSLDIVRKSVFIEYPILIITSGLLFTNLAIYICATAINFCSTFNTSKAR